MAAYGWDHGAGWTRNRGSWGNRDYDRELGGFRGRAFGGGRSRYDTGWGGRSPGGYDFGFAGRRRTGADYGTDYDRSFRYDRDLRITRAGYDRNYKTDYQTRYGDPFGDRQRGTPIWVMEGSYEDQMRNRGRYGRADYDRNRFGSDAGRARYDRWWW